MAIVFRVLSRSSSVPLNPSNLVVLAADNWDDYSFKTLFYLKFYDEKGIEHDIGNVKIGFFGQATGRTEEHLERSFEVIGKNFFSLGQDVEYYQRLTNNFPKDIADQILRNLGDIVFNEELFQRVQNEPVFGSSFLRSVSSSAITGQYKRILDGGVALTDFDFVYERPATNERAGYQLSFEVTPNTKPSTNIHILIGRNGVGKTTALNDMVRSIIDDLAPIEEFGVFKINGIFGGPLPQNYFTSVTSISFSAFDPFIPPADRPDRSNGTSYFYIGLKHIRYVEHRTESRLKDLKELREEFVTSLGACFSIKRRKELWLNAILKLESDDNFAEMELTNLAKIDNPDLVKKYATSVSERMSSGHAIVLISITKLIQTIEEKTLVLIDEPESHLHPPLLSAFIRALSELLISRNAVAIIATHSPVVLQEVPKSCVWKMRRSRQEAVVERPEIETFAENVGVLTREVFGLEVTKSGFHEVLEKAVQENKTNEEILAEYDDQLGLEGRAVLRALIFSRDRNLESPE